MPRKKTAHGWNINNVTVNIYLLPIYAIAQYIYMKNNGYSFNYLDLLNPLSSGIGVVIISSLIYVYSSMFFQPDLDQHPNKPGKGTFPLGETAFDVVSTAMVPLAGGKGRAKKLLYSLIWPLNRVWFWLWAPYGWLLTHRGISHWPVVGVLTRVGYLQLILWFINLFCSKAFGAPLVDASFLEGFYFWNLGPGEMKIFFVFYFPVYLSDFCHSAVDFLESTVKGFNFCPPRIPRGAISKMLPFKFPI